jgi:predicted AlkP superfamily phosphohydrolase/phosphomutase
LLAGVGVPDLRGGLGTTTFFSSDESTRPQESENVVHVRPDADGRKLTTHLLGPRNPKTRANFEFDLTIHLDVSARRIVIRSAGQPNALELGEGQWSDWLYVKFKTGLLQSVAGMVRFYLVRLSPVFELYASPVNFDPTAPMFPISSPAGYASELAAKLGTFYTTGMVEDHTGLNNGRFGEAAYLQQCEQVMRERQAMVRYELDRFDAGFFYCLFDTPDRVAHMFWRAREEAHPANRSRGPLPLELHRVVEEQYRACDAVVGKALEYVDDQTLLIVLSDHGMSSFQRGFNVNTWLHANGLLALRDGVEPGPEAGDLFRNVDWSRTRAYALGLGGIYLNLVGREGQGIVGADEAPQLRSAIARELTGLADQKRGQMAIRGAVSRDDLYDGPFMDQGPDIAINFAAGYRVSWDTPLGGMSTELFDDNVKKWSGDHTVDPALVPGVLFMNHAFDTSSPRLLDLAPTILAALGVPKGDQMEGEALRS